MGSNNSSSNTSEGRPDAGERRSVLGRVDTILSAFDDADQVLSLRDLTDRSELPKSTVYRLIEKLVDVGWVERDLEGYRIGMRLFEIGGLATRRRRLTESAIPHLHALAASTGFAVHLGILDGTEVVYLHRIAAGTFDLPTRDGGRKPAYCTGLGKAMLAFDAEAATEVLTGELPRRTRNTLTVAEELAADLEDVVATGLAHDREEAHDGLSCVAAPIRSTGRAIAAVSVTGPTDQFDADAIGPQVRQVVAAIWAARFPRR